MPTGPWADRGAVANLQIAVLAGLVARLSHGRGVCLDVAMVDAMMTIPLEQQFVVNGVGRLPTGGPSGSSLPRTKMMSGDFCWYGLYECSDNSWLSIACMEHHFWRRLCQYLNRPDWLPLQFEGANVQNGMRKFLSDMFISKPRAAWLDEMWARDLPVAPVNSGVEVLQDPQISHRGSVLPVVLPGCQPMWQIGRAFTAGDKRFAPRRTMTVSGMDSEEVLAGLEYEEDTVRQLLEDRVVVATEFPAADPGAG